MAHIVENAERALVSWVTGATDSAVALAAILGALERASCTCGLVPMGADAKSSGSLFERLASETRTLAIRDDAHFRAAFAEEKTDASWFVSEPIADHDGAFYGALVVIGSAEAPRDEVLVALPRLAPICATILARDTAAERAGQITHRLNNLLAILSANIGYAASLLEDASPELPLLPEATPAQRADVLTAMKNAQAGMVSIGEQIRQMAKLAAKRGP